MPLKSESAKAARPHRPWGVATGRFLVLLGPSGSGKSTLIRTLAGVERLDDGEVRLGDCPRPSTRARQHRSSPASPGWPASCAAGSPPATGSRRWSGSAAAAEQPHGRSPRRRPCSTSTAAALPTRSTNRIEHGRYPMEVTAVSIAS
ncbi:MAG: ATP-binding cassette domain-containing protein [Sciscionella sp.]